jgi:hypothetical protein
VSSAAKGKISKQTSEWRRIPGENTSEYSTRLQMNIRVVPRTKLAAVAGVRK